LAETPLWKIHFDEALSPPVQGSIPIKWVNFTEAKDLPNLKRYANETHYLAIQDAEPTLYLNSGFEGLPDLFSEGTRPIGLHLALYETVSTSIAKSAWLAMFQTSLAGIKEGEGRDYDWPDLPWQENVLKQLLPHIFTNLDTEAALQEAGQRMKSGEVNFMESEALAVISQKIINEGKAVRKAIQQMDRENY
jgi:hypothetical protein